MGNGNAGSFRDAMRRLTSAVSVISTVDAGSRHGLTITSVSSLSMQPPSLLCCINHSASLHEPLVRSGRFCINVLRSDQIDIADAFGRSMPAAERFRHGGWDEMDGIPYLLSAQANVFCALDAISSYGTHSIMVGKVQRVIVSNAVAPLLYEDGHYTNSILAIAACGRPNSALGTDASAE